MLNKYNEAAEQGLLGTLLVSDKVYDLISKDFKSAYFYNPVHARIYDVISKLNEDGRSATVPILSKHFANDPDLDGVGGSQYLIDLAESMISVMNAPHYAHEIFTLHISRMLEAVGKRITELSNDTTDAEEKISLTEEIAFGIRAEKSTDIKSPEVSVNEAMKTIELAQKGFQGIKTGLRSLDKIIKGFRPSSLYILAARPAMGKTALSMTMAINAAQDNKKVLFISLEMDAGQLQQRAISRFSGLSVDTQMGNMMDADIQRIFAAAEILKKLPVSIDDQPAQTVGSILSKARRHMRLNGLDIIFIDYLGLIQPDDMRQNKVHQIEQITTGLKKVAKILKVPIVLMSQLSRALEIREDKRPILSDLRDSGAIEQDADVVMFIYRHEYYLNQPPKRGPKVTADVYQGIIQQYENDLRQSEGKAEVIIAKNRQGRTGVAHAEFDGVRQLFEDLNQMER